MFYGHGNLAIARDRTEHEYKIEAGSNLDLLVTIAAQWNTGKVTPVFVSEGTPTEKLNAVHRSAYLRTVHDEVLRDLGKTIVIYGLDLNSSDEHISAAVRNANPDAIAISVFTRVPVDEQEKFCDRMRRLFRSAKVVFFDAESSGAWVHASAIDRMKATQNRAVR